MELTELKLVILAHNQQIISQATRYIFELVEEHLANYFI